MKTINRTERGWAGHFIAVRSCMFRRNTLVDDGIAFIVVSTVGNYVPRNGIAESIGLYRYYETMVFYSDASDQKYHDADVSRQISFEAQWALPSPDMDNEANAMHENVVTEIMDKLRDGLL